jgi:hypothetical protein
MCAVGITHIPDLARVRDAATEAGPVVNQVDQLRTDIANVESGLEVIMAQLARQKGDLALAALGIIFCTAAVTSLLGWWLMTR